MIHSQVFLNLEGKRGEWDASNLGYKLVSIYYEEGDDSGKEDNDNGPRTINGIHQLLTFL